MSDSYDIFIKQPVHESLKKLRGSKKRAIEKFIDYLSDNPFEAGDFSESDTEVGRFTARSSKTTFYVREKNGMNLTPATLKTAKVRNI